MRIVMASWEYPPLVVGGLAAHVDGLSRALARRGHEVVVLTLHHPDAPDDSVVEGVRVLRAHADLPWVPHDNFLAQMASANHKLVQLTTRLRGWRPHVVHAHDWLVAWAGDTIHALWDVPLVATVHATERGRNRGHLPPGQPSAINAVEWWLTYQADAVVTCSQFMVDEVRQAFHLPNGKVVEVPNGVDPHEWAAPPGTGRGNGGPWVFSWGRIQQEKGFQTLVEAAPLLRSAVPGIRVVIAGRGGFLGDLQHRAHDLGVADIVSFLGFVPDDQLVRHLQTCSCAVIPSLYEPFGIVALEALAAGAPLVAAASGGLTEVLGGTEAGLLHRPGDPGDLAHQVVRMLTEPGLATRCQTAGQHLVAERYTWDAVAAATEPVYEKAVVAGPTSSR
jgi:glycogen synthase